MKNKEEAALALNGSEYGNEGSEELFTEMKAAGLVAVFGTSDDLVEFRGAITDEDGAWGGATVYLTRRGLLVSECEEGDTCPYFLKLRTDAPSIEAKWDDGSGYSWTFETAIPHATFDVVETDGDDRELFCRGIVFALVDLPA